MNYSVYEILSILFFVLAGLAAVCAAFYFLRFQIAHVIAVLSGRQEKKQIARWRDSMAAGEHTTERLGRNDDGNATSLLAGDGEETTSVLAGDGEETTSILCEGGEDATSILSTGSQESSACMPEEKRMIHSAYIISLSGEPEPVQNT